MNPGQTNYSEHKNESQTWDYSSLGSNPMTLSTMKMTGLWQLLQPLLGEQLLFMLVDDRPKCWTGFNKPTETCPVLVLNPTSNSFS